MKTCEFWHGGYVYGEIFDPLGDIIFLLDIIFTILHNSDHN